MVLVDAVQERMFTETWPDPSIAAVTAGFDYREVVGLNRDHRLTESEWAELIAEERSPHHERQAARELPQLQISRDVLAKKQQLRPGSGSVARQAAYEEAFQRELLNLSTNARFSTMSQSGQTIQLTEPERVADEVRWVLQRIPSVDTTI
ncbi:Alpha/beta hydrolase, putative [Penicillium digitatum PHI26]|uniref:Alpha/beta hydrolase, putative n=2 Tax=Penicillium digitatum TaxID=36651 RepID=K9FYL0_PEND2|nr:Alpha/beta hydrolase, putative [Penicillium digitatum Pd1]EKV05459.1 Alpha/beta hydrolase, putative [Penicillium digitatum Pd1]EKV13662.1 Alpha/beta hydrolase, putative [Penicillium digitatum PHI26]